jgi:hypothetical protein
MILVIIIHQLLSRALSSRGRRSTKAQFLILRS